MSRRATCLGWKTLGCWHWGCWAHIKGGMLRCVAAFVGCLRVLAIRTGRTCERARARALCYPMRRTRERDPVNPGREWSLTHVPLGETPGAWESSCAGAAEHCQSKCLLSGDSMGLIR